MNVKKSYWIYVCLFLVSNSIFAARAASTKCGGISSGCDSSTYNCSRTTDVRAKCPDFGIVTIKAQEQLDYLRVVVTKPNGTQQVHVLQNPPGGIADYPAAGIGRNQWVINRLSNVLRYGDTVELAYDGYGLSSSALAVVSPNENKSLKQECEYTGRPYIVNFYDNACGKSMQVCIAKNAYCINTDSKGKFSPGNTLSDNMVCIAKNNICPPPTQCAFSKRVSIPQCSMPSINQYLFLLEQIGQLPSNLAGFADNYDENGNRVNDHGPLWQPPKNNGKGPLWLPPKSGEQESSGSLQ